MQSWLLACLETWGFRLWEGKKPGDFRENLEIHAIMDKWINDSTLGAGHGDLIFFHIMYYTTSIFLNINQHKSV
jgi:hypothetical protein